MIPSVTIGDETVTDMGVDIGDAPRYGDYLAMNKFLLGADFFEKNRVYIAYQEGVIYFTPYDFKYNDSASGP